MCRDQLIKVADDHLQFQHSVTRLAHPNFSSITDAMPYSCMILHLPTQDMNCFKSLAYMCGLFPSLIIGVFFWTGFRIKRINDGIEF